MPMMIDETRDGQSVRRELAREGLQLIATATLAEAYARLVAPCESLPTGAPAE